MPKEEPSNNAKLLRGVGYAIALAGGMYLLWHWLPVEDYIHEAILGTQGLGWKGWLVYAGVYVVFALGGVPRTPLNIGAGVIFDYLSALELVMVSAAIAQALAFWVARSFARSWIERRIGKSARAKELFAMVDEQSGKLVLLVRLNPFIPGALKDYGFGITPVRFRTFMIASIVGLLPIAMVHVYVGWVGGLAMLYGEQELTAAQLWLIGLGLLASALLAVAMFHYGGRALAATPDAARVPAAAAGGPAEAGRDT